ncbi:MAG: DUF1552 domain-containing protein, partial [Phycisphaerae bacterium]|nr:DUF1552 domain-containing protein [Phycisphaerae bacterium]
GIKNHFKTTGKKADSSALIDVPLADRELPEKLEPLAAFKDRMTIIQSLSGEGFSGNHSSGYGALSCHNSEKVAVAPSVDCLLGQHLSAGPYPMYGMAMNGRLLETGWKPEESYCYPNISAYKPGMPVAYQASPRKAFVELFGAAIATPEQLERQLTQNGNLMDFLSEDARRVGRKLSGDDKERFALYLDSFESLRNIEQKKAALTDRIRLHAPELDDRYDSMTPTDRIHAHFEIGTAALIAGLTNVVTLRPDTLGVQYSGLGLKGVSVHAIGHMQENRAPNGWSGLQSRMEIEKFQLNYIAEMAKKLQRIPEGDGNMLDNTLIVYMSCMGGGHHGPVSDWPFVLIGGMADKLKMGRYIEYPKYREKGHRTIANLYLSLMQAAGMKTPKTFGQLDANLKHINVAGPLEELMVS